MQAVFPMPLLSLFATNKMAVAPIIELTLICTPQEIHRRFQPYA
jgi:hypothetical protein